MEEEKEIKTDTDIKEASELKNEAGFNISAEYAESLPDTKPEPEKRSTASELFEWLDVLVTAIISVVIIFSFIFRVATIRGDIVVISRNADNSVESVKTGQVPIIKRVIATGGQTVDIDFERGVVSVDGKELDEPYTRTPTTSKYDVEFPIYVPEGYIFVLGDNRNDSMDSRDSRIGDGGLVDTRYVLGHAVLRVFPFSSFGRLDNK